MRSFAAYVVAFFCAASRPTFAREGTADAEFVLGRIRVDGNKHFGDGAVRNLTGVEKGERYEEYNFDYLLEAGLAAVEGAYYAEGFDAAFIGFEVAEKKKGEREVKILVEEGPQTLVSEVVVRGVSDEHAAAVRDALDVEPGAPLSAPAIRLLVSRPVSSTRPSAKLWMTPRGPNFLRNLG